MKPLGTMKKVKVFNQICQPFVDKQVTSLLLPGGIRVFRLNDRYKPFHHKTKHKLNTNIHIMFEEPCLYPRTPDSLFGFGFALEPWAVRNQVLIKLIENTYWHLHTKTNESLIESIFGQFLVKDKDTQ